MKKLFIILITFIGISEAIIAQKADEKIGKIINNTDWFTLSEEYPKLKSEMQSVMLKKFSEAMIGFYFNQPDSAIQAIDWIFENAQNEIGFGNVSNLILIKSTILGEQGLYTKSCDNLSEFLTQISKSIDLKKFPVHNETLEFYEKMRNEAKPEVIRPNRDIEIPITIEKTGRGQIIYIPVNINHREYKFIFDTGAGSTFVSERFANEVGLRITQESFKINGVKPSLGKRGTIDSIMIGDIVFKNPNIIIGSPNEEVDTVFQVDAVLGIDFIKRIGETQIYPQEKKIVFPIVKTGLPSYGRNLMLTNGQPYLKAYSNTEKLLFHFDSGNVKTDLHDIYYEKHKDELDKLDNKKKVHRGGYGGVIFIDSYQKAIFPITVGDCNFELTDIDVLLDKNISFQNNEDGSLGMDFISLFKKVIINFNNMFVKVEK
jgi:predicted aspartyl protease